MAFGWIADSVVYEFLYFLLKPFAHDGQGLRPKNLFYLK